jgi:hypothetical protein
MINQQHRGKEGYDVIPKNVLLFDSFISKTLVIRVMVSQVALRGILLGKPGPMALFNTREQQNQWSAGNTIKAANVTLLVI